MIYVFLNLVLWMQFIFKEIHGLSKPELAMWGRWQKEHHHKTCHLSMREEGSSQDEGFVPFANEVSSFPWGSE